ncbi:cupin domain-containing protein [Chloroflexota bacterium]
MYKRAQELIDILGLSPHPEGGYYKEVYRSGSKLSSPVNNEVRNALTDIYFLLVSGQVSRFHKVVHDEIWNFYEGDPLELIEIKPDTLEVSRTVLGDKGCNISYKHCVEGNNWQAACSRGEYSLLGCTVAPGFEFSDFEFLKDNKDLHDRITENNPELSAFM